MKRKNSTNRISGKFKRSRIFILLLFFVLTGCNRSERILIYYSGNLNGNIEDCRCPKMVYGSFLNHMSFYSDSLTSEGTVIKISTGNLFPPGSGKGNEELLPVLAEMTGYDAVSLGKNDIPYIDSLRSIPLISGNVKGCERSYIKNTDQGRIRIFSLTDRSFDIKQDRILTDSDLEDYLLSIKDTKRPGDLDILISNIDIYEEKKIFNRCGYIDIMISGTNQKNEFYRFGDRFYASPGRDGRFIGKLTIGITDDRKADIGNVFYNVERNVFYEKDRMIEMLDSLKISLGIQVRKRSTVNDF